MCNKKKMYKHWEKESLSDAELKSIIKDLEL